MKTRIISGAVGVAILIIVLILHQTFVFPLALAFISTVALLELFRAADCMMYYISMAAAAVYSISVQFFTYYGGTRIANSIMILCILVLFLDFILHHNTMSYTKLTFMLAVTILVSKSLNLLIALLKMNDQFGIVYVILALSLAWIADTGAYFSGTLMGNKKLCPSISPKKTVEGFLGGMITSILIPMLFSFIYGKVADLSVNFLWLACTSILCAAVSVLGDLSASVLKRQRGIKDYGRIMPGHGGVMDRFDSVLFTIPLFYAMVNLFAIYQ